MQNLVERIRNELDDLLTIENPSPEQIVRIRELEYSLEHINDE